MTTYVLDASVGVAMVRREPSSDIIEGAVRRWAEAGHRLTVPAHFWLEVVNSLRNRHHLTGDAIVEAIHLLDSFSLETIDLEREHVLLSIDAVERHKLSSYDAAYLVVAEVLGGWLATIDRELLEAAGEIGVDPSSGRRLSEPRVAYASDVTWPAYQGVGRFLAKLRADALRDRDAVSG